MPTKERVNREMLIKVRTDVGWLREGFENHLRHHWAITISMIGVAAASVTSLIIALLTK